MVPIVYIFITNSLQPTLHKIYTSTRQQRQWMTHTQKQHVMLHTVAAENIQTPGFIFEWIKLSWINYKHQKAEISHVQKYSDPLPWHCGQVHPASFIFTVVNCLHMFVSIRSNVASFLLPFKMIKYYFIYWALPCPALSLFHTHKNTDKQIHTHIKTGLVHFYYY